MSFRNAYSDLKRRNSTRHTRGLIRDKSPEEEKKMLDEYYRKLQEKKNVLI